MKVLIVSGASGGHIFPAIGLFNELKNRNVERLLLLPEKAKLIKISLPPDSIGYIRTAKLNRVNLSGFLVSLLTVFNAGWDSFLALQKFKPDIVIGFGSLNSLPAVILAWFMRVKTVIHEQNVVLGQANNFLVRFVDKIAISFMETKEYLGSFRDKAVLSGNPLRPELSLIERKQALDYFSFSEGKLNILVVGGSQGSDKINQVFKEALVSVNKPDKIQVIHLAGARGVQELEGCYSRLGIKAKVFDFFQRMQFAYSAADLVVCRSGAMSISELIFFKLPALLIPYPYAGQHQLKNAQILSVSGAAVIMEEERLTPRLLADYLNGILNSKLSLEKMRLAYDNLQKPLNSSAILADLVLDTI